MTHRQALLVAHGSPADPDPQEARMAELAQAVGDLLPDWQIKSATLAKEGALEAALQGCDAPLIYPFFMAEGYFTGSALPKRLAAAGMTDAQQLAPFGASPAIPDLVNQIASRAAREAGFAIKETTLLLAAHGSKVSRTSADTTLSVVKSLSRISGFAHITAGFVEEAPFLNDAARGLAPAICLPFFALRAGHVLDDVPHALADAGFTGPCLPPLGEDENVPALIATALANFEV